MFTHMGEGARRTYTPLSLFEHYFLNIEQGRPSPNAHAFVREYNRMKNEENEAKKAFERANRMADEANRMVDEDNEDGNRSSSIHEPSDTGDGDKSSAPRYPMRPRRKVRDAHVGPTAKEQERTRVSMQDQRPLPSVDENYRRRPVEDSVASPYSHHLEANRHSRPHYYGNQHHAQLSFERSQGYHRGQDQGQGFSGYQKDYYAQTPDYQEYPEQWRNSYGEAPYRLQNDMSGRYTNQHIQPYYSNNFYEQGPSMQPSPEYSQVPVSDHGPERPAYSQDDYEHRAREEASGSDQRHYHAQRGNSAPEHAYQEFRGFYEGPPYTMTGGQSVENHHHFGSRTWEGGAQLENVGRVEGPRPIANERERSPSTASTILLQDAYEAEEGQHHVHQAEPESRGRPRSGDTTESEPTSQHHSDHDSATDTRPHHYRQRERRAEYPRTPEAQTARRLFDNVATTSSYGYVPALDLAPDRELPLAGPDRTANDHINAYNTHGDRVLSEQISHARTAPQREHASVHRSRLSTVNSSGPAFSASQQLEPYRNRGQGSVKPEEPTAKVGYARNLDVLARAALLQTEGLATEESGGQHSASGSNAQEEDTGRDQETRQSVKRCDDEVEVARQARVEKALRLDAEINADIRRRHLEDDAKEEQ
ncbi:hypothetical protein VdG1_02209 [Verticillium dahliae VDG1]|nr:hypothetical protein VdG1_02209 [Verticillium dahliae VDG1]